MAQTKFGAVLLLVLASFIQTNAAPNGFYPDDWNSENIMEYLMSEESQRLLRPHEAFGFNTDNQRIGMVSGVALDSKGDLFVFHRANRPWTAKTFEGLSNVLSEEGKQPIERHTIFKLNPRTGRILEKFGANQFNVPHGISFDQKDNMWLTDVGRHQVIRIPKGSSKPDLVLGEKFVPGSDDDHFCKPTDVAVASNGDFFVSDGYCNSRIMKFSKDGKVKTKWGMPTDQRQVTSKGPDPFTLSVPHSITLIEAHDLVCVADRENERALCYNAGLTKEKAEGSFNRTLIPQGEIGKVYALDYDPAANDVVVSTEISRWPTLMNGMQYNPPRAFTFGMDGKEKTEWAFITTEVARNGPSIFHDLCVSADGNDIYMADLTQMKVIKYTKRTSVIGG